MSLAPVTWSVGYDAAGRVTSFEAPDNTTGFGYDANGNRLSSTQTAAAQTTSRSYSVAGLGNRLTGFTQSTGGTTTSVTYGYNANGDLTSDGLRSFSYDAEGRLSAVTTGATDASPTTRYVHNALGQRVFKTEPLYPPAEGDESDQGFMASLIAFFTSLWNPAAAPAENLGFFYAYDEDGTLLGESGTGGANSSGEAFYLWMPTSTGPLPVMNISATSRYAITADHLNTPRRLTEWNGALAWQWTYSAFGDAQPTVAGRKFASVAPAPGDFEFNLRYPGQTADKESGLYYNYFRSYSPGTGRYTQPDPMGLAGGWNGFAYVDANPLSFVDPDGLMKIYEGDGVTFHSYPGPQAGGIEHASIEHARKGSGESYHLHLRDSAGREARISSETWKPLTPGDQRIFNTSKQMQRACDNLTDGQKKFFDRVNREVFHRGSPTSNQLLRLIPMRPGGGGNGGRGNE